ncbi:putative membrane protein [Planifilum fimeticola]|uniref:Putative membrane protein n=1 Tax=Planifilum fimeticola TaxID=201975 RepID=A0A2T0LB57_9BACL|nr:DMT family transporter [Planifilum fimeticola]PRX39120.1 putative membrane protein [Planifilum fimeticola]
MWFLWAILSAVIFGMSGFLMKVSSARHGSTLHTLLGLYLTGTLGFFWWAMQTETLRADLPLLLAGFVIGLGSAAGNLLFMKALDQGPASLTSPLVNTNILVIILFSMLVYGERLSGTETAGVILLILAVSLIPFDPDEELKIKNIRWYFLVFAATLLFTLRNGGLKVTEEMALSGTLVLFYGYLLGLIWFLAEDLLRRIRGTLAEDRRSAITGLGWGALAGIFSFVGMQLYAVALIDGPASIVAPLFATNSLVVAVFSILFYRERLSRLQTLSLILLFAGLVLVRI